MSFYPSHKNGSTITIRVMSVTVFCLFVFLWVFFFMDDIFTITQHLLSGKTTHYNRLIGAIVITCILLTVQQIISKSLRMLKHSYALTFLPSMLLLAMLSDFSPYGSFCTIGHLWCVITPVVILIWAAVVWAVKQYYSYDEKNETTKVLPRQIWINLFEICIMMTGVALLGNTRAVSHYEAHIEQSLNSGNIEEALRTGSRSQESSVRLTLLRAYALSQKGELGERLFSYPIVGCGNDLLPFSKSMDMVPQLLPFNQLFDHLGARPVAISSAARYYKLMEKDSLATKAMRDYQLCGLLIDRKLDAFAQLLPNSYTINSSLPRHFKEAIVLYTHLRNHPTVVFDDAQMEEDWKNFQELKTAVAKRQERTDQLFECYGTSYWYYYYNKHFNK